ncbi:glycine zipper 2TM domain-containing protein [Novosphingobium olei]|nr:hypothetical protein [Novosphingobium olei]
MIGKWCAALALGGAMLAGSMSPALARDWDDEGYYEHEGPDRREYREEHYRRDADGYESYEHHRVEYRPRYATYDEAPRRSYYRHRYHRCGSGTTGAILGSVVGGLLGREVGRGGPWNEPSTTGLIVGAGAGALAGRAIERDGCR